MRRTDVRFMFFLPCLIALTVVVCVILLMHQMFAFTHSYILEEQHELQEAVDDFIKSSSSLIINKNFDEVNKKLKNLEVGISIFDDKKNLLASNISLNDVYKEEEPYINSFIYHINVVNAKHVDESRQIDIKGRKYYLRTSMPIDEMADLLNRTERNIFITFLFGSFIVIALSLYMFFKVRNPFIKLQKSAIKISNGDFSNEIFVPADGPFVQLSLTIYKMAERLKSQIKELQKNEDFRKSFIEDISHEVKTPLTGILSSLGLLKDFVKDSQVPPNIKKCLSILDNNANRLDNLIKQILSLANIEDLSMLQNKNFIKFDLKTAVENALISCKSMLVESGIKVNFQISESVEIMGDIILIEQAVSNLIINAVKYSKSPVLDIAVTKIDDKAVIYIADYGVGIAGIHVEHIFERFYRADKARSRELGGTGLGLAIVKNIILLHGGTIGLESELGKGCTFRISLPCAAD